MKNKVSVLFKYLYGNPVRRSVDLDKLISNVIVTRATFPQKWLDCDDLYDPNNDFKITKLELDKNKKLKRIVS